MWLSAGLFLGPIILFLLAALWGSFIPRNAGWKEPERGITIMVADNGLHTELVLPIVTAQQDWRNIFPLLATLRADGQAYTHVAIGWGERDIFLNTPTWSQVSPATLARIAVHGGTAVMRITPLVRPAPDDWYRPLTLHPQEYRRLVRSIETWLPPTGNPHQRVQLYGFDTASIYYAALGRYTFAHSCNQWTSDRLADAGIKTGRWTPFAGGVMRWVPRPSDN